MNVGRFGLYESGLKQGLIPLLFLQKDKTGKGRGRRGMGFPDRFIGLGPSLPQDYLHSLPHFPTSELKPLVNGGEHWKKRRLKKRKSRNETRFQV